MALTKNISEIISEDTSGLLGIHPNWERVRLGDVASVLNGFPFESAFFSTDSGFPLIRIRDVSEGKTRTFYRGEFDEQFLVQRGELLIGMDGEFNTARWRSEPALLNQRVCKLTPDERWYHPSLLEFALPGYLSAINAATSSITVKHLSSRSIEDIELPLPPRNEQDRIVEKLEELLSDLDAGVAELKAAQRKLAQYRQSLLKAAVEGALTADWRAARARSGEPQETGADLLQRILTERRTRWETKQLAKYAEQGKTPPKGWQAKYPEPVAPDAANLSALPENWVWATLSQVGWLDRGRSKHRPRNAQHLYGGPYPFVQTGDIRDADTLIRKASATYSEAGLAQSRLWPPNTLCITIAANIGKTAMLAIPACFPDSVVGFLPVSDAISVEYIEYFMRTAQQMLEEEAPATAQKNINLEILERVVVPVPPHTEQIAIVDRLLTDLAAEKAQDEAIDLALRQAAAQRKNILKAAFAGQLVPQDPNDEPASALLERIRAERAAQTGAAKPRGRKPRTTA